MFGMFISTFFLWNLTGFFFFFTFGRNCYGKVEFAWHLRCQILRMNHLADICTHSPTTLRDWQARRWLLPKGSKRSTDPRLPFQWVYKATWKSHGLLCGLLSVFSSPTGLQAPGGSIHGDKKNELGSQGSFTYPNYSSTSKGPWEWMSFFKLQFLIWKLCIILTISTSHSCGESEIK